VSDLTSCRAVSLDDLSSLRWTDGFQTDALAPLDELLVETTNTRYAITVLLPSTGDVLIRGGRYFPAYTRARVAGSSLGGSCLKIRGIYVGCFLEIARDGHTVRTTRIRSAVRRSDSAVH
jgi:hypothetical protein